MSPFKLFIFLQSSKETSLSEQFSIWCGTTLAPRMLRAYTKKTSVDSGSLQLTARSIVQFMICNQSQKCLLTRSFNLLISIFKDLVYNVCQKWSLQKIESRKMIESACCLPLIGGKELEISFGGCWKYITCSKERRRNRDGGS